MTAAAAPPLPPPRPWAVALLVTQMLVFVVVLGGLSAAAHRLYVSSWDLAMNDQAAWLLAHGREPFLTTRNLGVFSHHLSLVLYPLAALYRLAPGPVPLLYAQAVAVALAAVPVFLLARDTSRSDLAAVVWVAVLLSYPTLQHLTLHDLHFQPFALPCFAAALLAAHRQRWRAMGWWLALTLLTREDAGLAVTCFGGGLALAGHRRPGLLTAGCGLVATALVYKVIIPAINPGGAPPFYTDVFYHHLGGSPVQVLLSPILRPGIVWEYLTRTANLRLLANLLTPLALLPLVKPSWAAGAAATLFLNMVSGFWPSQSIDYHYQGYVIPFFVAAAVAGSAWLADRLQAAGARRALAVGAGPVLALCGTFLLPAVEAVVWPAPPGQVRAQWLAGPPTSPLRWQAQAAAWQRRNAWAPACDRLVASLPPTASVAASMALLPHVSARQHAWLFPSPFVMVMEGFEPQAAFGRERFIEGLRRHPIDYLLLLTEPANPSPLSAANYRQALRWLAESNLYEVAADLGAVRLYRRVSAAALRPAATPG